MPKGNDLLKNWLSLNRYILNKSSQILLLAAFIVLNSKAQVANYVVNGSFEEKYNCTNPYIVNAENWDEIDAGWTTKYNHYCFGSVPFNGFGFQYPKSGSAYITANMYCLVCSANSRRTYLRNKLVTNLIQGQSYCVKFHVAINNNSTVGISNFGAFFGDNSLDTITKGHTPLIYLTPQIQNDAVNIITDTLNWTIITGTFVANGTEKYCIVGNFFSDQMTNTIVTRPTYTNGVFTDVCLDDVSCIPIDLPANAGKDTSCIPGTTVYIGRTRDVGIDEACTWFKWPDMVTPIATGVAGLPVSPVQTSTYIVKQQLWCSGIKYDTVVVYKDGVGLSEFRFKSEDLRIYPVPASDVLIIETQRHKDTEALSDDIKIQIINSLGQLIREEEIEFKNYKAQIQTSDLAEGVYTLQVKTNNLNTLPNGEQQPLWQAGVSKRFVISR